MNKGISVLATNIDIDKYDSFFIEDYLELYNLKI